MFIMCDDFPSVVLYLDNKSKETSSLSTPNDNDPVFCVYELRFTLKKTRICKEIFFGEGRQLSYLAFAVSYFGFHIIKIVICSIL